MDLCYLKDQICDELHGAKDYIKHAFEIRPMAPTWAKSLVAMSATELEHATMLYKMFEEYHAKLVETYGEDKMPEYLEELIEEIVDLYTEKSAKVKYLHDMYK